MYSVSLLLPCLCLSQLFISVTSPSQVYYLSRKDKEPALLLDNVTGLRAATGDPKSGVLYVCANSSIVEYTVDYANLTVRSPGEVVYTGEFPASPVLDVWGNLYFLDSTRNTVNVHYASTALNHTITTLYWAPPFVSLPSALVLDDFFDFLYWSNLNPVANSSLQMALLEPTSGLGVSQTWAGYRGSGVDGLAISKDWLYISSQGLVYRANKRNPKDWKEVETETGNQTRVVAAFKEEVYLLDIASARVYRLKGHNRGRGKDEEDREWGLWNVLYVAVAPIRNWGERLGLCMAMIIGLS